jgi:hypothetical protein
MNNAAASMRMLRENFMIDSLKKSGPDYGSEDSPPAGANPDRAGRTWVITGWLSVRVRGVWENDTGMLSLVVAGNFFRIAQIGRAGPAGKTQCRGLVVETPAFS